MIGWVRPAQTSCEAGPTGDVDVFAILACLLRIIVDVLKNFNH